MHSRYSLRDCQIRATLQEGRDGHISQAIRNSDSLDSDHWRLLGYEWKTGSSHLGVCTSGRVLITQCENRRAPQLRGKCALKPRFLSPTLISDATSAMTFGTNKQRWHVRIKVNFKAWRQHGCFSKMQPQNMWNSKNEIRCHALARLKIEWR